MPLLERQHSRGPLQDFYQERINSGIQPQMARLTLARKIAAVALIIWKKGESFDPANTENTSSLSAEPVQPLRVKNLRSPCRRSAWIPTEQAKRLLGTPGLRVGISGRDKALYAKSHGAPYAPSDNPKKL